MNSTASLLPDWDCLRWDNHFTDQLPADPVEENSIRQVHKACFSRVLPKQVSKPLCIAHSREVAAQLGIGESLVKSQEFAEVFSGNSILSGMDPFAMCYGGHQFGNWAGQLGDGRAINLGQVVDVNGQHQMLQLKGAGPTPYSRFADGLAVLRSSLREFLCSEAMHHLGVPTTRALSLVLTGDGVTRDMFYDGNAQIEPGAVVCRVAPSFLRLGSFQIFASRGDIETLKTLADYCLRHDFPELGPPSKEAYAALFAEVCLRTAKLMVHWMRVGFVHGVMNTDNLSLLGLTIDYGPYGWLEDYDPNWTPNTTDAQGKRYRFGNQPQIAQWNLAQFAGALLPLVDDDPDQLQPGLQLYVETFDQQWTQMMCDKLGLGTSQGDEDQQLFGDLFECLMLAETDMTIFYRRLAEVPCQEPVARVVDLLRDAYYTPDQISDEVVEKTQRWYQRYCQRVQQTGFSDSERRQRMNQVNPLYVLRNYLAQQAIDRSAEGDHSAVMELLEVLRNPYQFQEGKDKFAGKRPEWARHRPGCSMLSCSS
ncbi:MAG: hypothetical protein CBB71_13830 [Rhodopirellula sp. TMED11]|nr:MAG: hypothetical protein CBB71_13830 [Rhodopirellula sp. TMED11]